MTQHMDVRRLRTKRIAGVVAAVLLSVVGEGAGQVAAQVAAPPAAPPAAAPRAGEMLRGAIDQYKRGDYEQAHAAFHQIVPRQGELSATERQDFTSYMSKNTTALQGRGEGSEMLARAAEELRAGHAQQAGSLLRAINANQYLTPADRQILAELERQHRQLGAAGGKADGGALLSSARSALQQGDFEGAEQLAAEAEKAGTSMTSWLQPWSDSPAKVRRDVQLARQKAAAPKAPAPETKDTTWTSVWPFRSGKQESTSLKPAPEDSKALLAEGYRALQAGDTETARKFAYQIKEARGSRDEKDPGADQLLSDIHRTLAQQNATRPAIDPKTLVRDARNLMSQSRFDDAENLLNQAAGANASWGLFDDTPDKARRELQRLRNLNRVEESVKVLAEARKLFASGKLEDAKVAAWRAKELHGPYSPLDLGDRPEKLLEEIRRAEVASGRGGNPAVERATRPGAAPASPAQAANKQRALALVVEARACEQRGQYYDAYVKARDAKKLGAVFTPSEDSPDAVLLSLAGVAQKQVATLVQQATTRIMNSVADPNALRQAKGDLDNARNVARNFGLDVQPVDQKVAWLHEVATKGSVALAKGVPTDEQPLLDPQAQQARAAGLEKLERARLELNAGNYLLARKLAEDAFPPQNYVQAEAQMVLRSIDVEEHNQKVLAARRTFEAGVEAFNKHDYVRSGTIFSTVPLPLLLPDQQARLREIMGSPSMQLAKVQHTEPAAEPGKNGDEKPGKASVTDLGNEDILAQVRALDEVHFQSLRQRGLQAQTSATELFKAGQDNKAIEVLQNFLAQVSASQLEANRASLLRGPVENRLQQYRTLQAQKLLSEEQVKVARGNGVHNESKRQAAIQKNQEEVAKLMKQCNQFMREGKLQDAMAMARQAQELDPDNQAAQVALTISSTQMRMKEYQEDKDANEEYFYKSLRNPGAPAVDTKNPLALDRDTLDRASRRTKDRNGALSAARSPAERAIEYKLLQPTSLNFKDTPLYQAIQDLQSLSGINIVPNTRALQEANVSLEHPLTLSVENISLKSALNLLLAKVKLTYVIKDEVLTITTDTDAAGKLRQVVYPVTDLVVPVENHPVSDVLSIEAALRRHLQPNVNTSPSPVMNPNTLPQGTPVSSLSGGLGQAGFGTQQPGQPGVQISKQAPSRTIEDVLMNLITNTVAKNSWEHMGGNGSIQYFPMGMALVVNQTQEVQEEVYNLLAALRKLLDLEVAIEMRVVSVSEQFYERIGVDFDVNLRTPTSRRENDLLRSQFVPFSNVNRNLDRMNLVSGLTQAGTLTPDLNIPIRNSSFGASIPPLGGYPGPGIDGGLSLGLAFLSDIQVFMFLEAAQGDKRTNVMQAPKITVFNGQTAQIFVGVQQFYITNIQLVPINGQILFNPQQTPFPIGMLLQVTPVISADRRFVRLNLTPTITNLPDLANVPLIPLQVPVPNVLQTVGTQTVQVGQPTIFQMFLQQPQFENIIINTTVNVPDGGTVLLGGLKTMAEARTEMGPPVLSKIPYLSRLFRNVGYGRDGQSLMVMVTPRIIINEEEEQIFLGNQPPIPRP